MAGMSIDGMESLVQEVFAEKDGLKRFLEVLVSRVMAAEVGEHIGAARHQRNEERRGPRPQHRSRW